MPVARPPQAAARAFAPVLRPRNDFTKGRSNESLRGDRSTRATLARDDMKSLALVVLSRRATRAVSKDQREAICLKVIYGTPHQIAPAGAGNCAGCSRFKPHSYGRHR